MYAAANHNSGETISSVVRGEKSGAGVCAPRVREREWPLYKGCHLQPRTPIPPPTTTTNNTPSNTVASQPPRAVPSSLRRSHPRPFAAPPIVCAPTSRRERTQRLRGSMVSASLSLSRVSEFLRDFTARRATGDRLIGIRSSLRTIPW